MILKTVTITGADDKVNPEELYELSKEFPFVEWGILWYPKKMDQPRYPSKQWIKTLFDGNLKNVNISLHICGADAENFAFGSKDFLFDEQEIWRYIFKSNRIQLNFQKSSFDLDDVLELLTRRKNYDFRYAINRYHALDPGRYVVIQANEGNKILNACLEREPAIEFLFDESRGKGKSIREYPSPILHKFNGYAGGITPDNVLSVLHDLRKVVPDKEEIWIDMESGIRTNNEFDFEKVKSVLNDVKSHIPSKFLKPGDV
jgi:hypothetical protein